MSSAAHPRAGCTIALERWAARFLLTGLAGLLASLAIFHLHDRPLDEPGSLCFLGSFVAFNATCSLLLIRVRRLEVAQLHRCSGRLCRCCRHPLTPANMGVCPECGEYDTTLAVWRERYLAAAGVEPTRT